MRLDNSAGNGKSKTCSGVSCAPFRLSSPADLEDPGQVVILDASAPVGDGEPGPAIGGAPGTDPDLPVLARVANGIADEIRQGAGEFVAIALHRKAIGVVGHIEDQVDMAPAGMLPSLTHDVVGQLDQAQRTASLCPTGRPSVEPGQLEEITHQTIHPVHGLAHLTKGRILILDHPVLKALGERPEAGQRSAQVVGHERHQLTTALLH